MGKKTHTHMEHTVIYLKHTKSYQYFQLNVGILRVINIKNKQFCAVQVLTTKYKQFLSTIIILKLNFEKKYILYIRMKFYFLKKIVYI